MSKAARIFLIAANLANGIAGIVCGLLFVAAPDGALMGAADGGLLEIVQAFPLSEVFFRDFRWIGFAMLLAIGLPGMVAAVALLRREHNRYRWSLLAGVFLFAWCTIEMLFMPNWLCVLYAIVAALTIVLSDRMASGQIAR